MRVLWSFFRARRVDNEGLVAQRRGKGGCLIQVCRFRGLGLRIFRARENPKP